ncbi:helix-turn-helix transcriptional regulator [Wolbachia endosymbiont (group A) of Agelastica alni]|uniref:helix-turn-helix domain-containing protein n=1 Tax=Wolbachia endosymbiont (group A) of Agelastica alni TaxID=3066130 RepID=UPI003132C18A
MSTEKKIDTDSLCYYITQKVKNVRFELNCTQAEFAEKTDVAKSLIGKYERGIHSILPDTLEKIANKSSHDIEYFFPEPINCINSEDKKAFDLVQNLKRIKDQKVRDAVCALTRCVSEGIQIRKVITEIRPISYQMVQKAKDWRFARGSTQMELADKTGLPYKQISRYEQGEVSFKKAPQLADGLSLPHRALLPTSKEEIYCEDEDGQGENKILSIMQEYQKIGDQRLKDSLCTFVSEIVKISEENLK